MVPRVPQWDVGESVLTDGKILVRRGGMQRVIPGRDRNREREKC
jgi:hypothetical protein